MKQWTFEEVMEGIHKTMDELHTDRLPTCEELDKVGIYGATLKQFGGLKGISLLTGIPLAKPKKYVKTENSDRTEKWKGRPSRAFEIEADARKQGLSYADIQKAETLRMAGSIL